MSDHDDAVEIVKALVRISCRKAKTVDGEDRGQFSAMVAATVCDSLGLDRHKVATEAGWGRPRTGVTQ